MKTEVIDRNQTEYFDVILGNGFQENTTGVRNLGQLLFEDLPHRDPASRLIISHLGEELIEISLAELKHIVFNLFQKFEETNIRRGDTIFLASVETNSEAYTAILFIALAAYGARVFLPMYIEHADLEKWFDKINIDLVITPEKELSKLSHKHRQKLVLKELRNFSVKKNIPVIDSFEDLGLENLVRLRRSFLSASKNSSAKAIFDEVSSEDIALLITTSGSSGASKIIAYEHGAFLRNLSAWKAAGLFEPKKLGGRSFTPLFTHTMGIRTFMNALYLGQPIILINTDWFTERPETVRYFLSRVKPQHITGGPAVFRLLLEMSRTFPDLKTSLSKNLKTLVSCGAPLNEELQLKIFEAFNLKVHNALGTTETQQITSTVIKDLPGKCLGSAFPGVSLGLKKRENKEDYRLYIYSSYGGSWLLNDEKKELKDRYIFLGDIVSYKNDQLIYCQREKEDYLSDEFGVKIVIKKVLENYPELKDTCAYIKLSPLKFRPGLAALIIQDDKSPGTKSRKSLQHMIEMINERLYNTLDPLDFQHKTIKRFTVGRLDPVLNAKGIVSENKISGVYGDLITRLTSDNTSSAGIIKVKEITDRETDFTRFHNPFLGKMLTALKMDYSYSTAEGDHLVTKKKERKILDLTGGYGTNLLGHNNNRLQTRIIDFLSSGQIPLSDQFSDQYYPSKLAEKINSLLAKYTGKNFYTLFGSTGSEVVDMAIHHAYLEWKEKLKKLEEKQRLQFAFLAPEAFRKTWRLNNQIIENSRLFMISNKSGFHGNSSSARSLMGNDENRNKFKGILPIGSIFIDDTSEDLESQLHEALQRAAIKLEVLVKKEDIVETEDYFFPAVIGVMLEPVIGEGGIREINPVLPEVISKMDFPIIFDEIQCGLGRTGSFLASENYEGNYYLFSKALGGNFEKIASISIEKNRYHEKFGKYYVSTFSNGSLAAFTALETLKIIEEQNISKNAKIKGEKIISGLKRIQKKYPEIILSIEGKGLMLGLKFGTFRNDLFLRVLQEQKLLGYVLSSYLLNRHQLRILPSLSAPDVLRIEPSVHIQKQDLEKMFSAMEDLCLSLQKGDFYHLIKHLINEDPYEDNKAQVPEYGYLDCRLETPAPGAVKVAFIVHFAYPTQELRMLSRSLTAASDTGLYQLFEKMATVMDLKPFVAYSKNLYQGKIHLTTVVIPLDAASLEKYHRTSKKKKVIKSIQEAVDLAGHRGAKFIGLGGYTSILTNNGKNLLEPSNSRLMTGNTLTSVVGYNNFKSAVLKHLGDHNLTIGVVGAAGNIGKILCRSLLHEDHFSISRIILIGKASERLKKSIAEYSSDSNIDFSSDTSIHRLQECDAILVAVNTNDPIITAANVSQEKPVVICDLSIPSAVSTDIKTLQNVTVLPFSASIKLPSDQDVVLTSCSPPGTALCCLAETFLNVFEEIPINLRGEITYEGLKRIEKIAQKLGFIKTDLVKNFKSTQ